MRLADIRLLAQELRRLDAESPSPHGRTEEERKRQRRKAYEKRCEKLVTATAAAGAVGAVCVAATALAISSQTLHQQQIGTLAAMMTARASTAQAIRTGAMDGNGVFAVDPYHNSHMYALGNAAPQTSVFIGGYVDANHKACVVPRNSRAYRRNNCEAKLNNMSSDWVWPTQYQAANWNGQSGVASPSKERKSDISKSPGSSEHRRR